MDAAAAAQNMLTMGMHLDFYSTWAGLWPNANLIEPFSKLLKCPEGIIPAAMLIFGKPADDWAHPTNEKYHPEKVHYESW